MIEICDLCLNTIKLRIRKLEYGVVNDKYKSKFRYRLDLVGKTT